MTNLATAHTSTPDASLKRYIAEVNRIPLLQPEEELRLGKRCRDQGDRSAADRLVTSHLRLVVKVALGYRGYGLPLAELISEGNLGLLHAVERFDAEKGFRLSTYAMWWIRATIQQYIMRSKSLVKMGTTANERKLFFNLRKAKSRMSALEDGDMRPEQVELIAKRLGVSEQNVIDMNRRLSGDVSFNIRIGEDGNSDSWQDRLADDGPNQEQLLAERDELADGRAAIAEALKLLSEREREVFMSRRLLDRPRRLEEIATEFGVSRERVRQIEMSALEKVRRSIVRRIQPARAVEQIAA